MPAQPDCAITGAKCDRGDLTRVTPVPSRPDHGTAGFIGFHLAGLLLDEGFAVHGYDGMTDYYDVTLKRRRHGVLLQKPGFAATEGMLEDQALLDRVADDFRPDIIVHLAAQAGVRYSLETPAPMSMRT